MAVHLDNMPNGEIVLVACTDLRPSLNREFFVETDSRKRFRLEFVAEIQIDRVTPPSAVPPHIFRVKMLE